MSHRFPTRNPIAPGACALTLALLFVLNAITGGAVTMARPATPPAAAERIDAALDAAGHSDHTVVIYPALGHSLGPAPTLYEHAFAPIAWEPLANLVAWLDKHLDE